ncbi:shikimate dehydrogenase [Streptomyces sp. SL13]|uniref:Shikimate dehydrogenase n=1 Tax=Streptantibioticus silvisoli TaxID=2705255 RepID=A0AA90JZL8_9ACTN|nr:shikimate dehydrogenase [Streptantibioticus silvisoli]MDI5972161.1 shikimate dehydrogenase [Streptantibioticus silvisoli]
MTTTPQRRAAVLGSPIAHSLSPALHRAAYTALGLTGWSYGRHEVDEAALPAFIDRLRTEPAAGWAGLSLTMPLKRAVIPLLDRVGAPAAAVQAVNTVVVAADGTLDGTNTDIPGLVNALRDSGVTRVPSAAVLGAGATASSALAALAGLCDGDVTVYVRGPARAAEMRAWGERLGVPVVVAPWERAARALDAPLVIATTPAGATDALAAAVPAAPGTLFDVLYEPWPTALAAAWAARGGAVLGGLDLLVHQAVLQVELMTGRVPGPLAAMRAAGLAASAAR